MLIHTGTDSKKERRILYHIPRKVNLSVESTALAVGWLARENKVVIERKNGLIEIYNEGHFDFSFG